jgi:hypothetical protein
MKDLIRMNQLAGIITEGQAKKMMQILNENENFDDEDDEFVDINQAFKESPSKASYKDVLSIIDSYEKDDILNAFKSKFPTGKPINKQNYLNFAGNYIDDMSDMDYVRANWVSIFDEDIFEKAGLV